MFKSARSRLRAAVFACAAALGLGAYAATPIAVWDGESPAFSFSKLTRNGYTLGNLGGSYMNTVAADGSYLQIGNNNAKEGITLKKADGTALPASTIIVKCENITATDNYNRALIAYLSSTAYQGSHAFIGIARSKNGTLTINDETVDTVGAGCFIYQGKVWDNTTYVDGAFAPPETGGKTIALSYGNSAGTVYYVDGVKIDSNSNLKSSGFGPQGIVLGGVDTTGNGMFYPMIGMKITAIAFFSGIMTDAEVAAFKFPSDADSLTISGLNTLTAEGGDGTGSVDKSFTSVVTADELPTEATAAFLKDSSWLGVVDIDGLTLGTTPLSDFGNANSTICLSGNGVTVDSLADNVTFAGILAGGGTLNVTATPDSQMSLNFTGDATAFAGDITIATGGKARVVFGSQNIAGNNNCLVVGSDAAVTVASGKTWTAPAGFVIKGAATVNGTLSGTVYGDTGVITVTKNQACTVATSWTGTVKVAYNPGNVRIKLADYGSNASAKIEIVGDANGAFSAFPATDWSAGTVPSITAPVNLTANWTVSDGWAAQDKVTTFAKLSGSGTLTVTGGNGGVGDPIYYTITTLENFTGTLAGARGKFTIGTIVASSEPTSGAKLVNCTTTNAPVLDDTKVTYNGAEQDVAIEFKAGDGIYVVVPNVTITVPEVANATVAVTVGGETVLPTTEGGTTYSVLDGAAVVVTYTATEGYKLEGTGTFNFSATDGYSVDVSSTKSYAIVARTDDDQTFTRVGDALTYAYMTTGVEVVTVIDSTWTDDGTYDEYFAWDATARTYTKRTYVARIGAVSFTSLAAAIAYEGAVDPIVVLLADVTLDASLAIPAGKTLTMDLGGFTIYSGNDSSRRIVVNGTVTMTNGVVDGQTTVYDPNNGTAMIRVNGSLTLGANLTIRNTINAVAAFGTGSLTVNGATINALGFAISTNGSATGANASNGTVLAINSGTITSTDVAVYLPSGTMTINGGTITGSTGVYAKGGSLSVPSTSTAVITGNGANAGWSFNGNGANSTGDALVIDNSAYPYGPATATIAGGTYESTNGDAIGNYTKNAETLPTATGFVSGGTFSNAVAEEFCAEGFEPKDNGDGTYGVREDKGWVYSAPGYWDYTGTWTEGAALGDDKVTISDGATYSNRTASAGQLVTVAMTLSFDDVNDDEDGYEGAKAAIRLGAGAAEGAYVFQLYTYEGSAATWKNATGFTPAVETDYNVLFVLDLTNKTYTASIVSGATTNVLSIGESITAIPFACQGEVTPVQTIDFVGSGTVSSIEGSYEDAPAPVDEFVNGQEIGSVTLDTAQATWLNDQKNYAALLTKIESMSQAAFNDAYLLNLDITGEFSYEFKVTNVEVGDDDVTVTVSLTRTGALTENEKAKPIVGTLKLKGTAALGTEFTVLGETAVEFDADADFSDGATETTVTVDTVKTDAKFYQPVIE